MCTYADYPLQNCRERGTHKFRVESNCGKAAHPNVWCDTLHNVKIAASAYMCLLCIFCHSLHTTFFPTDARRLPAPPDTVTYA